MKKPIIIGIDPSGAYNEGLGTTGFGILDPDGKPWDHCIVRATEYASQLEYWTGVLGTIDLYARSTDHPPILSIEDYVLYGSSAKAQINSEMETSKLIGAICVHGYQQGYRMTIRNAAQVKKRWSNKVLEHKNIIYRKGNRIVDQHGESISPHSLDALRHALHCYHFDIKKGRWLK